MDNYQKIIGKVPEGEVVRLDWVNVGAIYDSMRSQIARGVVFEAVSLFEFEYEPGLRAMIRLDETGRAMIVPQNDGLEAKTFDFTDKPKAGSRDEALMIRLGYEIEQKVYFGEAGVFSDPLFDEF